MGIGSGPLPIELWGGAVNQKGHLVIGGEDTVSVVQRYGTPLYLVDHARLIGDFGDFVDCFRRRYPQVEVDYSYKTNPLPGVLQALHEAGAGAEVISPFELWLALRLGVPPSKITFNGPAKTEAGLETAIRAGIRLINIDSKGEIPIMQGLARKYNRIQQVGIRVTTSVGWSSQFGLSIQSGAAREAFEDALASENLDACALHIHLGTGIKEPKTYGKAIEEVLEFAEALREDLGARFRYLDFGGGFGVPTVKSYSPSDLRLIANGYRPTVVDTTAAPPLDAYATVIADLMDRYWRGKSDRPTLLFEPGRAVTSSSQLLLLSVLAIKKSQNGHFNVILDGGLNVAQPASFESHETFPASRMRDEPSGIMNLCGPLCHPADVLAWKKNMPLLEPGDVIAIMDAGAYLVSNQMHFSNPKAAAVMVRDGTAKLIRERESFEGVVRLDSPIVNLD
ncbi:MAG: hypothetical protein OEW73_00335 [Gammaproteobacteria bacterium]|nr:hypothetical protein [Gammaproteobacteria bacterium]MDH5239208.1 hypothetical protein [Gammaproteobacteria bacterium]MDH5259926.1 hypothetical protein [Gammaproteobacteria bacterium]